MLGKLPVPGRPTNLDYSRARAYCACSRCGWGLFGHFSLIFHFSFLSPSLSEAARYRLKYCLKGPLSQNNQPKPNLMKMLSKGYIKASQTFWQVQSLNRFWSSEVKKAILSLQAR